MKVFFIITSLLVLATGSAQEEGDTVATPSQKLEFYEFTIPASINGSNIDFSPYSNITANFTDTRLSMKLGFPLKDFQDIKAFDWTYFLQPYVKGSGSVGTLWKADARPIEFGMTGGFSVNLKHSNYFYLDENKKMTNRKSSERVWWLNVRGNLEGGNYIMLNSDAGYGMLKKEIYDRNGYLLLSINQYFHTDITSKKWKQGIFSLGLGYAKTNNYSALKTRTFEEGTIINNPNPDLPDYQSVVKTTLGKEGTFHVVEGLTFAGEYYFALLRRERKGSIYFGNRYTYCGIGKSNYLMNGYSGLFFNIKDSGGKDSANFSIGAQFDQLNKAYQYHYLNDNTTLSVQAALPLKFLN
jgi:hypothetical protein